MPRFFAALAFISFASVNAKAANLKMARWQHCQAILSSVNDTPEALENAIVETYKSLILNLGKEMIADADLEMMLEEKSYFLLPTEGPSSRDHFADALRELGKTLDHPAVNKSHLFSRLESLLRDELRNRNGQRQLARDERAQLARPKPPEPRQTLIPAEPPRSASWADQKFFSIDGKTLIELASRQFGYFLQLVNTNDGSLLTTGDMGLRPIRWMTRSRDQRLLALLFDDMNIRVLDFDTMALSESVSRLETFADHNEENIFFRSFSFSEDGSQLYFLKKHAGAGKYDQNVITIDWKNKSSYAAFIGFHEKTKIDEVLSTPHGKKTFYVFKKTGNARHQYQMAWLDRTNPAKPVLSSFGDPIYLLQDGYSFLLSPDGSHFLRYSRFRKNEVWKTEPTPHKIGDLPDSFHGRLEFSPDGRFVVSDKSEVYEIATQKKLLWREYFAPFTMPSGVQASSPAPDYSFAFSGDSRWFARQLSGYMIEIYDAQTWNLALRLQGPQKITSFGFSPDGRKLFVLSQNERRELTTYELSDYTLVESSE